MNWRTGPNSEDGTLSYLLGRIVVVKYKSI
jgi:hypothetical protein